MKRLLILSAFLSVVFSSPGYAQKDTLENQLSVGINFMAHGEYQGGGLPKDPDGADVADQAGFMLGRMRLNMGYIRPGVEAKAVLQNMYVWGMKGNNSLTLYEGWVKLSTRGGLFAQLGRVALSYDDERIIGPNDFAMAAQSHDVLIAGYEGHGHTLHTIFAYNQNGENVYTNTYYVGGAQYYKLMQTLWYHYDFSKLPLGASLLFMNVGMQAGIPGKAGNEPRVVWQQMAGTYLKYSPKYFTVEASYYHQWGQYAVVSMDAAKINAWMASFKATAQPFKAVGFELGYDYLSGDDYVPLTYGGTFGLPRHDVTQSFTPLFGSRTKFYGMLDYFYESAYIHGFSPGLQNAFAGVNWTPFSGFNVGATYHYLAAGTKLSDLDSTLGHDVDLSLGYKFNKWISLQVGYTQMVGTETMIQLKQGSSSTHANWGWFSLVVSPEIFRARW